MSEHDFDQELEQLLGQEPPSEPPMSRGMARYILMGAAEFMPREGEGDGFYFTSTALKEQYEQAVRVLAAEQVPDGTFRFEVVGVPTTAEDKRVLDWAFTNELFLGFEPSEQPMAGETTIETYRFSLPYNQGGCLVQLIKVPVADLEDEDLWGDFGKETLEWRANQGEWDPRLYTGWVVVDHYTDSMTNRFCTPIMHVAPGSIVHQPYTVWEM